MPLGTIVPQTNARQYPLAAVQGPHAYRQRRGEERPSDPATSGELADMIVTAQKREQYMQSVGISMAARNKTKQLSMSLLVGRLSRLAW